MSRSGGDQRERYGSAYVGKRVCVTGGAGFIGSHIASELLDLGADIAIIDDLSASDGQHLWYLIDTYPARVKFCFASVLEPSALGEAVTDCDLVIHLAAMNSVPRSLKDPERCFLVNALGTLAVCQAAREARVPRVVLASSSSAYGDEPTIPKVESMPPAPISPYAASKLAAEVIVQAWSCSFGVEGIALRYFNVFGSRQPDDSSYSGVVAAFIRDALQGQSPVVFGDGSQTRDFTPVSNVVGATLLAGVADASVVGQVINIGMGQQTSVGELAHLIAQAVGRGNLVPRLEPARAGDVLHSVADITKARALLGYRPEVSLEEGIAQTVAWAMRRAAVEAVNPELDPEDSRSPARAT